MKKNVPIVVVLFSLLLGLSLSVRATFGNENVNVKSNSKGSLAEGVSSGGKTRTDFLNDVHRLIVDVKTLDKSTRQEELLKDIEGFEAELTKNKEKTDSLNPREEIKNKERLGGYQTTFQGLKALSSSSSLGSNRSTTNSSANSATLVETETKTAEFSFWGLLQWVLIGIGVVLVIGLAGWGGYSLIQTKKRDRIDIQAKFSDLKNRNSSLNSKIEDLTKISTDLSKQVAQQRSELNKLVRNMGELTMVPYPPPPVISSPKEIPRFPVSVDDYIAKLPAGTPVKYDYKERLLVADTSNEGGLLIVQDEGRQYLIPSFPFFQTRSDYTNYFEKFYACTRPMGGNVWIKQPTTVNQVRGGWEMGTQGELEIR